MPRIDPHQLLSCLTVLLTPTGGILSENEVKRLANLMTKFSKKLVSKCVYVLILRNTDPPLLGCFMVEGGWNLVHVWLQDGYNNKNWALVSELLELLLMSPTTVEQLKTNNLPKLVKSLSKRDDLERVKDFANQLVQKWLKIVKEDQNQNQIAAQHVQVVTATPTSVAQPIEVVEVPVIQVEPESISEKPVTENFKAEEQEVEEPTTTSENTQACYKLAVRDGKHILCKVPPSEANVTVVENAIIEDITPVQEAAEKTIEKNENVDIKEEKELENKEPIELEKKKEKSNHDRQKGKSSRSSSRNSSSSSKSSRDKEKKSSSSSSSRDKSKDRSRSSKSKERSTRGSSKEKSDKEKHRSNGSLKSSSSSGKGSSKESSRDKDKTKKESKEKQAEKDKDTLNKIQPQVLQKIGRIPRKNAEDGKEEKKEESKKPSFSIEVRKNSEEKPKTVKVFNAKMRSTGLLEEAKPPPPRPVKKTTTTALPSIPAKRPSPIRDLIPPPEKKVKIEPVERPGAIKLIPPKPKRVRCGEDDWECHPFRVYI